MTGSPPLPPEVHPGAPPPSGRATRRRWGTLGFWLVVAFVLGILASAVPLPYAIFRPGPATDVLGTHRGDNGSEVPRIVVEQAPTYPTSGSLRFTTVRVAGGPGYSVNVFEVLGAWLDPDEDVYPVDQVFPPEATREQVAEENQAEMSSSQQVAATVALRALGRSVPETISVGRLAADAPAAGELKVGDVLLSVGGSPAVDGAAIRAAVQRVSPGDTVEVVVRRDGVETRTRPRTGAADGRTVLGIVLRRDFTLPFPVVIDAGGVGGPSAGLMFSLGIYDKLTDGALTGGASIAGTGTIDESGVVGGIGGIHQKLVGARAAGAGFFLAPADNCAEVTGREPEGLQVVRVATFDEARSAVEAIGRGDTAALPRCG